MTIRYTTVALAAALAVANIAASIQPSLALDGGHELTLYDAPQQHDGFHGTHAAAPSMVESTGSVPVTRPRTAPLEAWEVRELVRAAADLDR
mgnify:CR=1 FL=1